MTTEINSDKSSESLVDSADEDEEPSLKRARSGRNSQKYEEAVKPFSCEKCDMKYMSTSALNVHTRSKHNKISFDCELCSHQYTSLQKLQDHRIVIHRGFRYICHRCNPGVNQEFTTDHALKKHTKEIHKKFNLIVSKTPRIKTKGLTPHDLQQVCSDYSNVIEKRKNKKTRTETVDTRISQLVSLHTTGYTCQLCNLHVPHMRKLRKHMTNKHNTTDEAFTNLKYSLREAKTRQNNTITTKDRNFDRTDQCRKAYVNVKNIKVRYGVENDFVYLYNPISPPPHYRYKNTNIHRNSKLLMYTCVFMS